MYLFSCVCILHKFDFELPDSVTVSLSACGNRRTEQSTTGLANNVCCRSSMTIMEKYDIQRLHQSLLLFSCIPHMLVRADSRTKCGKLD